MGLLIAFHNRDLTNKVHSSHFLQDLARDHRRGGYRLATYHSPDGWIRSQIPALIKSVVEARINHRLRISTDSFISPSLSPLSLSEPGLVHNARPHGSHSLVIREKFPVVEGDTELATLRIRTNADSHTYDGLDWGAERAVIGIYEEIKELEADGTKKVTKFSIFGYSLGGLISRYAIGILHQRGFFRTVKPINFTTFSTPHPGLPRLRGAIGTMMHKLGPRMLSRTGKQFYGVDRDTWSPDDKKGRPLLEVMADKGVHWIAHPDE
ncbi:hypothetical protein FRC11_007535 [Ceratobasidium sp. 423]|nr:hypothetical protein FRC11_007535 [Ceratobasidium sp. 423]